MLPVLSATVGYALHAASPVTFGGGKITFQPPAGFVALTREEIARKFPLGRPPEQVFATECQGVFINFDILPMAMPRGSIAAGVKEITTQISRSARGVQWIRHEVIKTKGRRWLALEFLSQATDTKIHNHIYLTSFKGKVLRFGYHSTVALYDKYRAALEESRGTLRISD